MTAAFLEDDLTGHLLTLLWPLVVIWVNKMVDRGRLGKSNKIVKMQECQCHRQLIIRAGDRLEEVNIEAVSNVDLFQHFLSAYS